MAVNEYLTRTPTSSGNRRCWTLSFWVKRNAVAANQNPENTSGAFFNFYTTQGSSPYQSVASFNGDATIQLGRNQSGADHQLNTTTKYRDVGNWMHLLIKWDVSNPVSQERLKLYVNGALENNVTGTYPSLNYNGAVNTAVQHTIATVISGGVPYAPSGPSQQYFDWFLVDGQQLTPDVFGFYKDGDGYVSVGTTNATDFRPGQWMPHAPRVIKKSIERSGGFGVNGFYLPMNDNSNPGADFHCDPNSIIKLKGEDLPQPQNGAPATSDAFVSELRQETGTLGFDGAVAFDGDGDYLSIPDDSDVDLGNGDFTIEGYYYFRNTGSSGTNFWGKWADAPGRSYGFSYVKSTGKYVFPYSTDGSNETLSAEFESEADINRWVHFAAVRNGTSLKVYRDGKEIISHNIGTTTIYNSSSNLLIGRLESNTNFDLDGFVSNFRVVKGTALYTANFTAPTEPLTNVTNTVLLCCQSSTDATAATVIPTGAITDNGNPFATRNELTGYTVLAVPGASTVIGPDIVNNGYEWTGASGTTPPTGWDAEGGVATYSVNSSGQLVYDRNGDNVTPGRFSQDLTTVNGNVYHLVLDLVARTTGGLVVEVGGTLNVFASTTVTGIKRYTFTATSTTTNITIRSSSVNGTLTIDNVKVRQVDDAPRDYSADIKGSGTNKTLTVVGNAGVGYELGGYYGSAINIPGNGLYYDLDGTDYGTNDWTFECWVYGETVGNWNILMHHAVNGSWQFGITLVASVNTTRKFGLYINDGGTAQTITGDSTNVYALDQWHHVAGVRHNNVVTLYVNGVAEGTETTTKNLNLPGTPADSSSYGLAIGSDSAGNFAITGYIQDVRVYKGLAKYKGGFDVPKPYTPVGIEAFRTTADTCKNNFATLNPLATGQNTPVYSDGNLSYSNTQGQGLATMGVSSGKMYWEVYMTNTNAGIGVAVGEVDPADYVGQNSTSWTYYISGGKYTNFTSHSTISSYGASYTAGDIIGVALDCDSGNLTFYKNGVSQGVAFTGFDDGRTYFPTVGSADGAFKLNFGQNPSFSGQVTAGTNADDSGKGLFKYAPPSGFLALCEDNLPTPAIADPGKHFKSVLYTGDGVAGHHITGVGFKPDFVWLKGSKIANSLNHILCDSVRGSKSTLFTNNTLQEYTDRGVRTFDEDGFTLSQASSDENTIDATYVAWCWKAGGAAVSNTDGTITSQVSVNQDAGFSIVKFTAQTSGTGTVGHGLSKKPAFWIYKPINNTTNWYMYHQSLGASAWLNFSTTQATTGDAAAWGGVEPTSTVLTHGDGLVNQGSCILYAWTEIEGFSKFGSYVGNASDDGPFVYCGFKPAWVMIKVITTGTTNSWYIHDSSRNSTNPSLEYLTANTSTGGTVATSPLDMLSNGFKLRNGSYDGYNGNYTYIFMAFSESPFQTANAK